MYINKDARVKMHNSTVEQNRAQFGAGSAFLLGSFGNLTDSIMRENYAQYDGGAVYIEDATLNIFMVHMVRNLAEARGGGAYVDKNGKFYPTRATFTENSALGEGGALYFGHNSINDVKACQFYSNWAKSSAGAIFITATRDVKVWNGHSDTGNNPESILMNPIVSRCEFINNTVNNSETDTTGNAGAIEIARYGAAVVSGCSFISNKALKGNGGAISADGRNVEISFDRTVFIGNEAKNGGTMYSGLRAQVGVTNSHFRDNVASVDGGVFFLKDTSALKWSTTESRQNQALRNGGVGFVGDSSLLEVTDSLFSLNSASFYGGVLFLTHVKSLSPGGNGYVKVVDVQKSTMKENSAKQGGSVYWPYTNENPESIFLPIDCQLIDNSPSREGLATGTVNVQLNRWWPKVRSGVLVSELAPMQKAPFVETLDYYGRISTLDDVNTCDVRPLERKHLALSSKSLVRENAEVYGGTLVKAVSGVMRFSDLVIKGDINAIYIFDVQCTIGDPVRVNVTVIPCDVGYALSEIRSCDLCPKNTYSHEGRSCLPCPDGGNCSATYELRDSEWVKLGSLRDAETEIIVPFGELAPVLPRVERGVELPGTLSGFSLHKAQKWKRTFRHRHIMNKKDQYNYYNFSYCFWEQGVCPPGSYQYETKDGAVECEQMTNLTGSRLYNCLIGMNFYRCPQEEVSCPGIEFNGCLGIESPQAKEEVQAAAALSSAPYNLLGLNKECNGRESRLKPIEETKTLEGCATRCALTDGCEYFDFGAEGTQFEGFCYFEENDCESQVASPGLNLYQINMLEEVYLVFKGEMNATGKENVTNTTEAEMPWPQICNRTCNIGYGGVKCAKCELGYFRTASQECKSCDMLGGNPEEAKALYSLIMTGVSMVGLVVLWAYLSTDYKAVLRSCANCQCCDSDEEIRIRKMKEEAEEAMLEEEGHQHAKAVHSAKRKKKEHSDHHHPGFRVEKFKILLTFIQVFSQFKSNYSIRWPAKTSEYMRYLAGFNFDLVRLVALDCVMRTDYYFGFAFAIAMPIMAVIFCLLLFRYGRWYYRRRIRSRYRECIITGEPVMVSINWNLFLSSFCSFTNHHKTLLFPFPSLELDGPKNIPGHAA